MGDVTEVFGIPFPCEPETITLADLQDYSIGIETALSTVWANADLATQPPAAAVRNAASQSIATGVTTTLTYNTVVYDRSTMFNIGSPTLLTVQVAGTYLETSQHSGDLSGNVTSVRYAVLRAGAEVAYRESQNTGALVPASTFSVSVLMPLMAVGETITSTVLYTGTQPTLNFFGRLTATRLALP